MVSISAETVIKIPVNVNEGVNCINFINMLY